MPTIVLKATFPGSSLSPRYFFLPGRLLRIQAPAIGLEDRGQPASLRPVNSRVDGAALGGPALRGRDSARSAAPRCSCERLTASLKPPVGLTGQCLHARREKPEHRLSSPRSQHGDPKAPRPATSASLALPACAVLGGQKIGQGLRASEEVHRPPPSRKDPQPRTAARGQRPWEAFNYREPPGGWAAPQGKQEGVLRFGAYSCPLPLPNSHSRPQRRRWDTPGPAPLFAPGHRDTPCAPLPLRLCGTPSFAASAWWVEERPGVGPKGPSRSLQAIEAWLGLRSLCAGSALTPERPYLRRPPLSRPPAARSSCTTKGGIAAARAGTSLVQY